MKPPMPDAIERISAEKALIYLLGCAANSEPPQRTVLCAMDWKAVYLLSCHHTVAAAACMAVEGGLAAAPLPLDETQKQALALWRDAKNKAQRNNMLLDAERTALAAFCEEIGCWYLPLKGAVLKDLYPRAGMRQMADNDILFDPSYQMQICNWFTARSYKVESVGRSNHDIYRKEPIYNFELHTALFNDAMYPEWAAYYADVQNRLVPDRPGSCGRHFTETDFYVYITLHEYKHFSAGGTGVRNLLDRYIYCKAKGDDHDPAYLGQQLQALGIAEFETKAKALSTALFTDPAALLAATLPTAQEELLRYYLGSGAYGTVENNVKNQLAALEPQAEKVSAQAKAAYLLRRMFPKQKLLQQYSYPHLAKYKVLLPLCYAHRLIVKAIVRRKAIRAEMKIIRKT